MERDKSASNSLRAGTLLKGFCGGMFGRDSYSDKRMEAMGWDRVVARGDDGLEFAFTEDGSTICLSLEGYTVLNRGELEDLT